ncbi:MAG: hypothetical protein UHS47_13635, partial [Oscillospiraceae bacterium]|nr:hypothetical protein [Oscillospiraceae bacterium]
LCAEMDMLPSSAELEAFMEKIGFPAGLSALGVGAEEREILFRCGADIRDERPLDSVLERDVVTNYHVRQILKLRRELMDELEKSIKREKVRR